jgi:hypothetical protein
MSSQDVVTMFPQVIALGAAFNQKLYRNIGQIISTEARALSNQLIQGLTYWAPNVRKFRLIFDKFRLTFSVIHVGVEVKRLLVKIHSCHLVTL